MLPLNKDPNTDLEELLDFGYLNQEDYEEAKAKRARAQDLEGATASMMNVEIAQLNGAGSCSEGDAPWTDTETVITTTDGDVVLTVPEVEVDPSKTNTMPTHKTEPKGDSQPALKDDSQVADG